MLSYTGKNDCGTLTDDDYFNFVVSLWAKKKPEENNPEENEEEKFHILCLGALADPTSALINADCHSKLSEYPLDGIGILTRSTMPDHSSPETEVLIRTSLLRSGSKYYVLDVSSFTQN